MCLNFMAFLSSEPPWFDYRQCNCQIKSFHACVNDNLFVTSLFLSVYLVNKCLHKGRQLLFACMVETSS